MKRQRGRNRGSGGNKPQQNANRAFESNGPDGVKIRGAAQHVFEKYQQLARDALTAGDRVLGESYQQHAEHYFRVLRAVQPQRPASDIMGRDAFASGVDIDFEDDGDGEGSQMQESESDSGEWRQDNGNNNNNNNNRYEPRRDDRQRDRSFNRDERPRDDRQRDDRPRDDRQRDDRYRDDRPSGERQFNDRQSNDRQSGERQSSDRQSNDRQRDDRPNDRQRDDRPREDRYRDDRRSERNADPMPVVEPRAAPLTAEAEKPSSPMLRSQDGDQSQAPAFLQPRVAAAAKPEAAVEDGEPRPRARRRRAPRSFEGAGEAAEAAPPESDASE
jgi:hypothetical protein